MIRIYSYGSRLGQCRYALIKIYRHHGLAPELTNGVWFQRFIKKKKAKELRQLKSAITINQYSSYSYQLQ